MSSTVTPTIDTESSLSSPFPDQTGLVEQYLPLVRNIVDSFRSRLPSHVDLDDLFSVGVTGLLAAVSNFSPERALTFSSYAARRIRGAVVDELRRSDTRSRRARLKARMIADAGERVEQRYGRPSTDAEVRLELGLSHSAYTRWQLAATPARFLSLDCPVTRDSDEGAALHDSIPDESTGDTPFRLEQHELHEQVADLIRHLPENERRILALYYHEGVTFSEIAEVFHVSESRICQVHSRVIKKLRARIVGKAAA